MYENYIDLIKESLSEYRFHHSMCVAKRARELAGKYNLDENKAYLAGILHDITKEMPKEQQEKLIEENGHMLTQTEKNNHRVYHQMSGAAYIKNVLGITDKEVIRAVRYHTTGHENMTLFEMIIYLADFTSEDRSYPDVDVMREKTDENPFDAMLYSLSYTIQSVAKENRTLHPDTVLCYNWVLNYTNSNNV